MTTNASRAAIDIDAFERELQQTSSPEASTEPAAQAKPQAKAPGKSDPLAELARIVGQDDPFRALLASRGGSAKPAAGARVEPSFDEPAPQGTTAQAAQTPADAFDQYLATVEQSHQEAAYQDPAAFESDDQTYSNAAHAQPRKRSRLFQVGAGLGVLVLCVTGALAWKGLHGGGSSNGPVTVLADKTPLKVAPEKADGVDIPDQNKQIYERNAKDGQIKIVNREEQPVDVAQAARAAGREGGTTPGGALLTESLGEPRKIRTVAVKPDAPPAAMQAQRDAQSQPEVGPAPVSPIPTMVMPDGSNDSAATRTPASSRPSRTLASKQVPPAAAQTTPTQSAQAPAPEQPAPSASSSRKPTTQRVASLAPETTASTGAPAASETPAATTASVGGYAVQLGVRNSEADARAAFEQFQGKYSQLSGKPALIRQADVNGKSIYRVRVGPLAKGEANSLCSALKGAGAACFVAAN